jgi:uncharacterized protein (DUF305 family)
MSSYRHFLCVLLAPTLLSGCSDKPRVRDDEPTQADRERFSGRYIPPPAPPQDPAVTPSTGDPDHDFLRRMSDHHAGLMVVTHAAIESNRSPSLQLAIRKIEDDYDRELDMMVSMLRRMYEDRYVPTAAPDYTRIAQTLRAGTRDSTTFFRTALKNEEQVLQMINEYLPKARNTRVKRFADQLRRDEPGETATIGKILNGP